MTTHAPVPESSPPPFAFLSLEAAEELRKGLRGIKTVEIRQIGGAASAGEEVASFLQLQGVVTTLTRIALMAPPPLRRYVFRYQGTSAVLTLAPEVAE